MKINWFSPWTPSDDTTKDYAPILSSNINPRCSIKYVYYGELNQAENTL